MGSFSGFAASDFAPVTTGAAVYFDQLDASGGVYGRKIVYAPLVDDGTSPSGDTAAAQRLVQTKVFAVVGVGTPFFTGSSILRSQAVPTFGIQENTNAQWAGPTMYGAGGSVQEPGRPMPQVAYVAQQTHSHVAAVLAYNVAQSSGGCVAVVKGLQKYHIATPVIDFSIPYGAATLDADVHADAAGRGRLRGHVHGLDREHQAVPDAPTARHGGDHAVLARRLRPEHPRPQPLGRTRASTSCCSRPPSR